MLQNDLAKLSREVVLRGWLSSVESLGVKDLQLHSLHWRSPCTVATGATEE